MNASRVCDGSPDCPQGEDELACGEGRGGGRCIGAGGPGVCPQPRPCRRGPRPRRGEEPDGGSLHRVRLRGRRVHRLQAGTATGRGPPPSCPVPWWGPRGVLPIALPGGLSVAAHPRSATGCRTAGTGTRPQAGCPRTSGTAGAGGPGHPGVPAAAPAAPASSCVRGAAASRAPTCCTSATARPRRHGPASAPPAPVSGPGAARGAGGLGGPCGWDAWGIWGFPWPGMPRGSGGSRVRGCWGHPGGSQCWGCTGDLGGSHGQHCLGGGFPWLQLPKELGESP